MSFIKKIRGNDRKNIMLMSLGVIVIYSLFHAWTPRPASLVNEQEIHIPLEVQPQKKIPHFQGWQTIISQEGDDIALIFNRAGVSQIILQKILNSTSYSQELQQLKPQSIYYFKINEDKLLEMIHPMNPQQFLRITNENNHFITRVYQGSPSHFLNSTEPQKTTISTSSWQSIKPKKGDTLGQIFHRAGLSQKTLMNIMHRNPHQKELARIHPKFAIHFQIQQHQLQSLIFPIHAHKYLLIQRVGAQYQTLVRLGSPSIPQSNPQAITAPVVTPIQKTPALSKEPMQDGWISIRPVRGDTMSRIFSKAGLSQNDLQQVLNKNPYSRQLSKIHLNDEIRFKIQNHQFIEMHYNLDLTRYIKIEKQGPIYRTKIESRPMIEKREYVSVPVRGSLYQTAKAAGIPLKLIDQIHQIFFWQVQLSREIRQGDKLNMVYQTYYINGQKVKIGDVLAVSYQHANGVKYEAIRHQSPRGQVTYYHPNGTSLKKAFSRYPIRFSHISSNFGSSRKHPILHYRRPHKGIDLAAPIGTPIYAIGDGKIAFIGRQNGYGNMIKINHAFSYTTVYAHMLRFQKGLKNGSYVQKGQIIGFVGQSGLATGPHCHYELHLNHIPRNPTSVALPQAQPVPRQESAAFRHFTHEILAQLHLYEASKLASKN